MVLTNKNKFNKKYGFSIDASHSKTDVAKITGINIKLLNSIWDTAYSAYRNSTVDKKKINRGAYSWSKVYNFAYLNGKKRK